MKKFIICYNDENHYKNVWFDDEYVGSSEDLGDLLTAMYGYGLEDDCYNSYDIEYIEVNIDVDVETEEDFNTLHNYLCYPRQIDKQVWELLCKQEFQKAAEKIRELLC